jgi:hypothetical protein
LLTTLRSALTAAWRNLAPKTLAKKLASVGDR